MSTQTDDRLPGAAGLVAMTVGKRSIDPARAGLSIRTTARSNVTERFSTNRMPPSCRSQLDEHRDGWLRCPVRATARATRVRVLFGLAQSSSPPSHISGRHTCTPSSARITCPNSTSTRGQPPSRFADASSHAVGRRDAPWWRRKRHHTMRGERATAGAHTSCSRPPRRAGRLRLFRTMIAPVSIRALRVAAQAADAAASGMGTTVRRRDG